ncbi:MAG: hypothetical protein WBD20_04150, partial [Pirellulaceae bacterium]
VIDPTSVGILIEDNAAGNFVGSHFVGGSDGGADEVQRNVVSGNAIGVHLDGAGANNSIAGNYIGTDITGTLDRGNSQGITMQAGTGATIIGTDLNGNSDDIEGNVISGNDVSGVILRGAGSTVRGNLIGTDFTGVHNLGNAMGLIVAGTGMTVGGVAPLAANTIAFNAQAGVAATDAIASGSIRGNSIFSNVGLGIDLGVAGPLPNDTLDPDSGPNELQNYPVIDSANTAGATTVAGTFNSIASSAFTLDFYASNLGTALTNGQGRRYLGSQVVNTDGTGNATFSVSTLAAAFTGEVITATATDAAGNTSEFSLGTVATSGAAPTIDPDALIITVVDVGAEEQTFGEPTLDVNEGDLLDLTGDFASADASVVVNVNWGDGTIEPARIVDVTSFSAAHVFVDDNPTNSPSDVYAVLVTAVDGNGSGSAFVNVTVHNVDPVIDDEVSGLVSASIGEGGTAVLEGVFTDPGVADFHTLQVDWGDGSPIQIVAIAAGTRAFSTSHRYAGDGQFDVRYSVFDDDRDPTLPVPGDLTFEFDQVQQISVVNLPPVASINLGAQFEEGDEVPVSAVASDPGGDPLSYEWAVTVDGQQVFSTTSPTFDYVPLDSKVHTVELVLSDGQTEALFTSSFSVSNPAATILPGYVTINRGGIAVSEIVEGDTIDLSGMFGDKSPNDTHRVTVDYGDGSLREVFDVEPGGRSFDGFTHTYVDDPSNVNDEYLISIQVDDGTDVTETFKTIRVLNAAPVPTIQNDVLNATQLDLSATIDDPGVLDTHSYQWFVNGVLTSTGPMLSTTPPVSQTVNVTLIVTDNDGGSTTIESLGVVPADTTMDNVITVSAQGGMVAIGIDGSMSMVTLPGQVLVLTGDGVDNITVVGNVNAQIDAGAGNDIVNGGSGNDIMVGGSGDDVMNGGDGDDQIVSDAGDDVIDGGNGDDEITVIGFSDKTIVDGQG